MKFATFETLRENSDVASLDTLLRSAGAQQWSEAAIEAHKDAELAKAPPPSRLLPWQPRIANMVLGIGLITLVLSVAAGVVTALFGIIGAMLLPFGASLAIPSVLVALVAALVCGASVAVCAGMTQLGRVKIRGKAQWKSCDLAYYPLPDRASAIIVKANALLDLTATFRVEELRQDDVLLDPILWIDAVDPATGQRGQRAILVWDKDGAIVEPLA